MMFLSSCRGVRRLFSTDTTWLRGSLLWQNDINNPTSIYRQKEAVFTNVTAFLVKTFHCSTPAPILKYMRFLSSINFNETPDYAKFKKILVDGIKELSHKPDGELGNLQIIEHILNHGVDINAAYTSTCREGYTVLHVAAEKGDEEITKLLLFYGVNVNAKEINGISSFHLPAQWGYSSIVDHLLKRGAHVDSASWKGHTPLYLTVENRNEEIVKLLLEREANVNAVILRLRRVMSNYCYDSNTKMFENLVPFTVTKLISKKT